MNEGDLALVTRPIPTGGVIDILGGGVNQHVQSFLMGADRLLTRQECRDAHPECLSAILNQSPDWLYEAYESSWFEDEQRRTAWLYAQPPEHRFVQLHPINNPDVVPYHDDRDRISQRPASFEVHDPMASQSLGMTM